MDEQPNSRYLSDYRTHLADTQRHLLGVSTVDTELEDDNDDQHSVSDATFGPLTSHWSPEEKLRLFHALAMHSRWRLDLVTACVGTKSIIDVSVYVKSLGDAAAALDAGTWKLEREGDEEENAHSEISTDGADESRSDVSSNQSACTRALTRRRALPCAMTMSDQWVKLEEAQASVLNRVEPFWEEAVIIKKRQAKEDEEVLEGETPRVLRWQLEDTFAKLRETHLRVMDSLIRDAEEEREQFRKRKRDSEDDGANDQDENVEDTQDISPLARRRYMKRLYMRRKRAAVTGEPVVEKVARLKPGRRFRARLPRTGQHKHKKAEKRSEEEVESEDGDGSAAKDVPRNSEEADEQLQEDDRHPNVGGITAPHRIKREFEQMGIGGDALRREGYGLFHLGRIAQAMKARSPITRRIHAFTIRLLYAAVTAYIREVIGRVIVLRAEEVRQKGDYKAWHTSTTEIRARDVKAVVEDWEIDYHAPETEEEEKGTDTDDVDSEEGGCELEDDESLNEKDCAVEERYERQLWTQLSS